MASEIPRQCLIVHILGYCLAICGAVTGVVFIFIGANIKDSIILIVVGVTIISISAGLLIFLILRNNPEILSRNKDFDLKE